MIRAYLVDDEQPAVERLSRMLIATGRVDILGATTDPVEALADVPRLRPDVLFLDIHMPELSGFELLAELHNRPLIVFTTAYSEYALEAFKADSIDYLMKPVETEQLDRALAKADRFMPGTHDYDLRALFSRIATTLEGRPADPRLAHLASRSGDKVKIVDLRNVTHLFAQDKLTFAASNERKYVIDRTIAELEHKLDPARFVRIHRAVILNLDYLLELHTGFGGRLIARLKDDAKTELSVARSRVRALKGAVGL